jgi:hypothetical protein
MIAASGHGLALAIFPLIAAAISLVFAGVLLWRYLNRRRPHEGLWTIALLMYSAASAAMFVGVFRGWTGATFRTYWVLGAVLNVPYLAQGELYLLIRRRAYTHLILVLLAVGTAFAVWKVWPAPVHAAALANRLPLGKEVFGTHAAPYRISQLYAFPAYFLLLGGLVWAAAQMKGRPELRARTAGTMGIALGATVVAVGSGIGAGFHLVPLFSASLAVGIAVMFWGFLRASGTAPRLRRPAEPSSAG